MYSHALSLSFGPASRGNESYAVANKIRTGMAVCISHTAVRSRIEKHRCTGSVETLLKGEGVFFKTGIYLLQFQLVKSATVPSTVYSYSNTYCTQL